MRVPSCYSKWIDEKHGGVLIPWVRCARLVLALFDPARHNLGRPREMGAMIAERELYVL